MQESTQLICNIWVIAISWNSSISRLKIGGFESEVLDVILPTDTHCSENYSSKKNLKIKLGTSED